MALSPEQRAVLRTIKQVAAQKGASPKQVKAAIETGLVESNLRNLSGGDADSAGWRQERASLYKDPTNLRASVGRFFDETAAVKDRYGRAGDLAAAVQRPAAQYRGRYQQRSGEAAALMGGTPGGSTGARTQTTTRTVGGVDNSNLRRAAIAQFLGDKKADPVDLALQIRQLKDVPGQKVTTTRTIGGGKPAASKDANTKGGDLQSALIGRAKSLDRQRLPYVYGGGHTATPSKPGTPLDCSAAVSKVLGINPRVSGQFTNWGKPGEGGTATVYANDKHVFMKIRGRDGKWHFFGTSASNPGGGAGWIPASNISPDYLKGFTARHI